MSSLSTRFWRAPFVAALAAATVCGVACKDPSAVRPTTTSDGGVVGLEPQKPPKKKLVLATLSEPDTLNPLFSEMAAATEVSFLCHRELTMLNDRWEFVPDLAVAIPTLENGGVRLIAVDGGKRTEMEVTWRIRDDAKWEDGTPVTADDFVFAFAVQMDPTQEIIDRDLPERVKKMEVKGDDKKTLVVTWKEPFAFYQQFQNHYAIPAHVLKARVDQGAGRFKSVKNDAYGQKPLCNGPFRLKEWVPGQHLIFERNPHAYRKPLLDELVVRVIPSHQAIEAALLAGDIDGVTPQGGLTVRAAEELRRRESERLDVHVVPGLVWAHIDFNLDDPILKDLRVRKAIAHGVDRQGIIDKLYFGQLTLAHTYLPPRHSGYAADVQTYPFDTALAKKILDDAGYQRGADGVRIDSKGRRLSFKLSAISGIQDIEDLEVVVQANLREIGIEIVIDNKPQKAFFSEFARYRKLPHLSFYAWVMDPTTFGNVMWQEDMIPSAKNSWKGQNYPGWRSKEATALLKKLPTELDEKKRTEMLHRVQELWVKDLPSLPMYFRPVVAITQKNVRGLSPTGTQTPVSWNAEMWDVVR
jgi:peptide/nickel transport system substrate-binding protein